MDFNSEYRDDALTSLGLVFIRVYNKWHSKIQIELREFNLTHSQFVVLAALGYLSQFNETITQVQLAKQINMDTMTLSKLLKKLEALDYVKKIAHVTDTRAKVIVLTKTGEEIMNQALAKVEKVDTLFFRKLAPADQRQFSEFLFLLDDYDE